MRVDGEGLRTCVDNFRGLKLFIELIFVSEF